MGPPHLRHVVAEADEVLGREQRGVESAGKEDRRDPASPVREGGDLVQAVLEQARMGVSDRLPRHLGRVFELVRKIDERVAECELVRQRRIEDLRQVGGDGIRGVRRDDTRRGGHVGGIPPQAEVEGLQLPLPVVADVQLGVVADAVINAGQLLVHVLLHDLIRDPVKTVAGFGVAVGRGVELHESLRALVNEGRVGERAVRKTVRVRHALHAAFVQRIDIGRVGEISVDHRRRRHDRALRARVYPLADPLGAEEEEQLLSILVEVRARE